MKVEGEVEDVSPGEVKIALKGMKKGKAGGIGVCSEFLACSGDASVEAMTSICNSILHGDWREYATGLDVQLTCTFVQGLR